MDQGRAVTTTTIDNFQEKNHFQSGISILVETFDIEHDFDVTHMIFENRLKELTDVFHRFCNISTSIRDNGADLQKQISGYKDKVQALEERISELEAANTVTQEELETSKLSQASYAKLHEELKSLREGREGSDSRIEVLSAENARLKRDNKDLQQRYSVLEAECNKYKDVVKQSKLHHTITMLEKQLSSIKEKINPPCHLSGEDEDDLIIIEYPPKGSQDPEHTSTLDPPQLTASTKIEADNSPEAKRPKLGSRRKIAVMHTSKSYFDWSPVTPILLDILEKDSSTGEDIATTAYSVKAFNKLSELGFRHTYFNHQKLRDKINNLMRKYRKFKQDGATSNPNYEQLSKIFILQLVAILSLPTASAKGRAKYNTDSMRERSNKVAQFSLPERPESVCITPPQPKVV